MFAPKNPIFACKKTPFFHTKVRIDKNAKKIVQKKEKVEFWTIFGAVDSGRISLSQGQLGLCNVEFRGKWPKMALFFTQFFSA